MPASDKALPPGEPSVLDSLRPPPSRYRHLCTTIAIISMIGMTLLAFLDHGEQLNHDGQRIVAISSYVLVVIAMALGYTTHWYRPGHGYVGFVIDGHGAAKPARTGPYLDFWTEFPCSLGGGQLILIEDRRSYYFAAHPFELLVESPQDPLSADYAGKLYALLHDIEQAKANGDSVEAVVARHRAGLPNIRLLPLAAI